MWSLVLLCHFFCFSTIPSDTDAEKPGPAKRRRKSTSAGGIPLSRVGSPGSLLKPALTERQQMALLMQMTDPQKQEQQTPPGRGGGALYAGRGGAALYALQVEEGLLCMQVEEGVLCMQVEEGLLWMQVEEGCFVCRERGGCFVGR